MKATFTFILLYLVKCSLAISPQDDQNGADSIFNYTKSVIFKNPELSKKSGLELIQLAKSIHSATHEINGYNLVGLSYYYLNQPKIGISYLDTMLNLSTTQNDTLLMGKSYSNLGMLYENLGEYDVAYDYGIRALQLAEKVGKKIGIANSLGNLGNILIRFGKQQDAIDYLKRAVLLFEELNNKKAAANQYNSLGVAFGNLNKPDSQLTYLIKAKNYYKELNDPQYNTVLINLASYYSNRKEYHNAININKQIIEDLKKQNQQDKLATVYMNIAVYYTELVELDSAYHFINLAEPIFKKLNNTYWLSQVKKNKAKISEEQGKLKQAIQELKEHQYLTDSSVGFQSQLAVAELQEKYESQKKELQLKAQEYTIREQKQKSKYSLLLFGSIVFALLVLGAVFFIFQKSKQKTQLLFEKIKAENQKKQAEHEAKENERNRLAAELHDNVGSSVSFMSLKLDKLIEQNQANPEITQLKETTKEILNGLRETLWTLNAKSISNIDLCDKLKVYIKNHLFCSLKIVTQLNFEFIIPNEDVLILYRCAQEIINNINKHSNATTVEVSFISNKENELEMAFSDNGIGFKHEDKSESYGLRNIKARIEKIKGEIIINSALEKGTEIILKYKKISA